LFSIRIYFFNAKDIDPKQTFSEIQTVIDIKAELSFKDRIKFLILPISGGVREVSPKFAADCFELIYKAYGSKDKPPDI
jgi:hypothetical protein